MRTIEFHILQNFPPSNLNRDDSGAPKDCDFGGFRRQRISSQCLKRSVRQSEVFQQLQDELLGLRSKRVPGKVATRLVDKGIDQEQAKAMANGLFQALFKFKDNEETSYLLFVGPEEIERAVTLLLEEAEEAKTQADQLIDVEKEELAAKEEGKKKPSNQVQEARQSVDKYFKALAKRYKDSYPGHVRAVDVSLFGRMLADDPNANVDAACQVSHAISVNRMHMEFDYYTAVDDIPDADNAGASMIGTVGFASSCFYRFACIDIDKLISNLGGDKAAEQAAYEGIKAFAHANIQARPTGKQNTFAAHTLPSFIMTVARNEGQPVSLANAFEQPVLPSPDQSLSQQASKKLLDHFGAIKSMFGLEGEAHCVALDAESISEADIKSHEIQVHKEVKALLEKLDEFVKIQTVQE
mgnify:CR=1 FL=1